MKGEDVEPDPPLPIVPLVGVVLFAFGFEPTGVPVELPVLLVEPIIPPIQANSARPTLRVVLLTEVMSKRTVVVVLLPIPIERPDPPLFGSEPTATVLPSEKVRRPAVIRS